LIRTYVDSGVLIAAARGTGPLQERAMAILTDRSRDLVSSAYVRIEVVPKAAYFQREAELRFYEAFFAGTAVTIDFHAGHWAAAFDEACASGLSAFDALHVTAGVLGGCDELITTERPDRPIHRTKRIHVVSIAA